MPYYNRDSYTGYIKKGCEPVTEQPTKAPRLLWQEAQDRLEKALQDAEKALVEAEHAIGILKAYNEACEELDAHEAETTRK